MADTQNEQNFTTPQHEARKQEAAENQAKQKRSQRKPVRQWIEVFKRVPNEVGKVLLKTTAASGQTHSWYVGRETKAIAWMKEQRAAGVEIYDGARDGGEGRKYKFPA